jgi:hypothetical protein
MTQPKLPPSGRAETTRGRTIAKLLYATAGLVAPRACALRAPTEGYMVTAEEDAEILVWEMRSGLPEGH